MVADPILLKAEYGHNDHQKDTPPFLRLYTVDHIRNILDFPELYFYFKSRMPGQSFAYTFKDDSGAIFKNETVSFHGPSRMVFEEVANDVAMITVYEKQ